VSDAAAHAIPFDRVEARAVSKVYGRTRALAPTTLAFSAGESVALVGPNGAGKSTLVGILATLVRPSSGELTFSGAPASAAHRAALGVIAHESLCYGDLSGRENLAFFARLYRSVDAARRIAELLERVGLTDAADRPARTYSRGMLQRLAVARALLHRPRLLLLDEPFTGLDRDGCATLAAVLAEERARGVILVVVSHDFPSLEGLVDRVVVLRRGRLVHDGPAPAGADALRDLYRAHTA
jgi:heme exporter protein A